MKRDGLDVFTWIMRVVCWDGLMPLGIALVTWGLRQLGLGDIDWIGLVLLGLFVGTIVIRLHFGYRIIAQNHLTAPDQQGQRFFLLFGVIFLSIIEMMLLLPVALPGVAQPAVDPETVQVIGYLYLAYLFCLTIAMYPGRGWINEDGSEPLDEFDDVEEPWW